MLFFLFRHGNKPAAVHAGVRSMFAFWMGGATAHGKTTADAGGGRYVPVDRWIDALAYYRRKLLREQEEAREELEELQRLAAQLQADEDERTAAQELKLYERLQAVATDIAHELADIERQRIDRSVREHIAVLKQQARLAAQQLDDDEAAALLLLH